MQGNKMYMDWIDYITYEIKIMQIILFLMKMEILLTKKVQNVLKKWYVLYFR